MKTKKNHKIDLRNKQFIFFEIGMVVALAIVLTAFQYQTTEKNMVILSGTLSQDIPDVFMPVTRMDQPKPPEPPKPDPIKELKLVKNTVETSDLPPTFTSEVFQNTAIPVMAMPEEAPVDEPEYVYFAEKMPEFVGGMDALIKYLKKELRYPDEARLNSRTF